MFSPCSPPFPRFPPLARGIVRGWVMALLIGAWLSTAAWAQVDSQMERINGATALVERCEQHYQQQRFEEALRFCQKALQIYRQPLLRQAFPQYTAYGEGTTLHNLGEIYRRQGDSHRALQYFQQSLQVSRRVGDRYGEAVTLWNVGVVFASLEQFRPALDQLQLAFRLFGELQALEEQENLVSWLQYTLTRFRALAPPLDYQGQCQTLANTIQLPVASLCPP